MKERQIEREIARIQKFLNLNDWDISYRILDNVEFSGELTYVDYSRFMASLSFNRNILKEDDKKIKVIIMHEMSHIFTISGLREFEKDTQLKEYIGEAWFNQVLLLSNYSNEQMTVRLERLLSNFYGK